jgi:hypothetical protein
MSEQLVPIAQESLAVNEVVARTTKVQQVMEAVMHKDTHYGQIPGTPKPSLWQPGAEKLLMTFRLAPEIEVEDLGSPDLVHYRVTARIIHVPTQEYVGVGVGECSSDEEKFKWRKAVCQEEWDETPEDMRRKKWVKRVKGAGTILQIRTDPRSVANTILKMAKKRAIVDGAKSTCAASDLFDQDIEDLKQVGVDVDPDYEVEMPKAKPMKRKKPRKVKKKDIDGGELPPEGDGGQLPEDVDGGQLPDDVDGGELPPPGDGGQLSACIPDEVWKEINELWHDKGPCSEAQQRRLYALATKNGWEGAQIEAALLDRTGVGVEEVPWGQVYAKVVEAFESYSPGD